MLNVVMDVFNSEKKVKDIVRGAAESVHTEVEVCLEQYEYGEWAPGGGWELVLKAVVDLHGSGKLEIAKGKLSSLLRNHEANEWGQSLKIEKKAVPPSAPTLNEEEITEGP